MLLFLSFRWEYGISLHFLYKIYRRSDGQKQFAQGFTPVWFLLCMWKIERGSSLVGWWSLVSNSSYLVDFFCYVFYQENSKWVDWQTDVLSKRNTLENVYSWACGYVFFFSYSLIGCFSRLKETLWNRPASVFKLLPKAELILNSIFLTKVRQICVICFCFNSNQDIW